MRLRATASTAEGAAPSRREPAPGHSPVPGWAWVLCWAVLAVGVGLLVRLPGPATLDPDEHAAVLYLDRLSAGERLEEPLLSSSKPLLTVVHGLAWQAAHDWRLLEALTVAVFALAVVCLGATGPASCRARQQVVTSRQPIGRTKGKEARMPDLETVGTWQGRTMLDRDSGRIGTIDAIYVDDRTGQPEWALVNTGLFGTKSSFVPLARAFQSDHDVLVPYDKKLVIDAPRVDSDQHLSEADERQLWQHYGLDYDTTDRPVATGRNAAGRTRVGRETSGPTTDDAMTRSEELQVATTPRERGRVRLRKYVITERVEQAVPVRRERVRLDKDTMTDQEGVAEQLRKE